MFGESLKHVDRLFTSLFGTSARRVPAHMPHMVNKYIVSRLQSKFPNEFEKTSKNKLRSNDDMQFAFSYFYFMMSERNNHSTLDVFNITDVNQDGELNQNEIRTLAVRIYGNPLARENFNFLLCQLDRAGNCSDFEEAGDSAASSTSSFSMASSMTTPSEAEIRPLYNISKPIVFSQFNSSTEVVKRALKSYNDKLKYKFRIEGTEEVAFIMINENDTAIENRMDGIRKNQQKFICLNDNINHGSPKAQQMVKILHDLYESIVPIPSSFELPSGKRNPVLYIDEYREMFVKPSPSSPLVMEEYMQAWI